MPRRFSLELVAAARDAGLAGARLRHSSSGVRMVGRMAGRRVSLALPQAAGTPLADGTALRRLTRALAAAWSGAGAPAAWIGTKPTRQIHKQRKHAGRALASR